MLSKKPAIFFCSSSSLNYVSNSSSQPHAYPFSSRPRSDRNANRKRHTRRAYASVAGEHIASRDDGIPWSELARSRRRPTPYEIFNQKRNEPYSKHRFYQLVMLYHPDRFAHSGATCSRAVMLERYRLIVAANSILCDPVKRRAYDVYGFGWTGNPELDSHDQMQTHRSPGAKAYRWRHGYHNHEWTTDPMNNATWEDWERWYREQREGRPSPSAWSSFFTSQNAPPHPLLANKHALFSLVFLFALLGGVVNGTRAKGWNDARAQRAQLVHEETSKDLMATRQITIERMENGESREARIARFLREKDGYAEGEVDGRLMRKGDSSFCASGATKDEGKPAFWQKPPDR